MDLLAVSSEDSTGHIVATPHGFQRGGVGSGDLAELRVATPVRTRRASIRDGKIVDHPALVPAAFVVDDEQSGDIGKDINGSPRVVSVPRGAVVVGLHYQPHRSHRGQATVGGIGRRSGDGGVVDTRNNAGENIQLK